MSQNEELLRRLVLELQILEGTANMLQTRISYINAAMTEMQIASETLNGLKGEQAGVEVLVPIGGGSYVKAKLEDTSRVVVGIGATVSTERDASSAQEEIGARLLELEKARSAAQKQLEDVAAQINRTQNQVKAMTGQQSEGKK